MMYPHILYVKESRPYNYLYISRKLRPVGAELHFLPALLLIQFEWSLSEFAAAKTRRKMKVILKNASGKALGSDGSNKVFSIKIGSAGMKHERGGETRHS
jgi:hypothetical protein